MNVKLMPLSLLLILTACASTTPIAVSTPQWQVPAVDPKIKAQEMESLSETTLSLVAWNKWLASLPTAPVPAKQP